MKPDDIQQKIDTFWNEDVMETLIEYIKIPNKSPDFDAHWQQHGYMEKAVDVIANWCRKYGPNDMMLQVLRLEGRTPLIYIDVPGKSEKSVLLYGHLDKQPEMSGWREDLGPWKPVIEGDKLYGRGGADDGYAAFACIAAIQTLRNEGLAHPRCHILIEACEESGSYDLPHYIEQLQAQLGKPDLVICLDSGAGNYDQLWMTTSLRGNVVGTLSVETIYEGIHSGNGSGIVPDSFRVARMLLERVENQIDGRICLNELHCPIPKERVQQAKACAEILGDELIEAYPFHTNVQPLNADLAELILNRTWRPALTVTGAEGIPAIADAGNVLRPLTALKLSMRLPPLVCPEKAAQAIKKALEEDPPYHAKVEFNIEDAAMGWHAPLMNAGLSKIIDSASQAFFNKSALYMGEGGTIPFMGMLGEKFPDAQFMITGVLGPHSNAHGPNEFLHLPMVKKVSACVAYVLYHFLSES